jgi:AcrR family transcriptional regulator
MGRPARLSREAIVAAATALVEDEGPDALTLRSLGLAIGADPSAVYRHLTDKDELLRAVGDHLLRDVVHDLPGGRAWDDVARTLCLRLRTALMARPHLAELARWAPTRQPNELRLTEVLLGALRSGGFDPAGAAAGYHALIELTVGAATIDGGAATGQPAADRSSYAAWRRVYAGLPADDFPHSRVVAPHLYRGTAGDRFAFALDALLRGLAAANPKAATLVPTHYGASR